jgi:hypothetical protein
VTTSYPKRTLSITLYARQSSLAGRLQVGGLSISPCERSAQIMLAIWHDILHLVGDWFGITRHWRNLDKIKCGKWFAATL